MSVSHQPHSGGGGGSGGPDGPGGSGSGGGPSGGGSGGVSGTGTGGSSAFQGPQVNQQAATGTATPGQSSRPQQSQQMVYDNKSYHLSPPLDSHSRFVSLFLLFDRFLLLLLLFPLHASVTFFFICMRSYCIDISQKSKAACAVVFAVHSIPFS